MTTETRKDDRAEKPCCSPEAGAHGAGCCDPGTAGTPGCCTPAAAGSGPCREAAGPEA